MAIQLKNPWGVTADNNLQREDLFNFDLGPVCSSILGNSSLFSNVPGSQSLPDANNAWFYGTMVTMPTKKVETAEIYVAGVPHKVPTYILPPDGLKVDFMVDSEGTLTYSRIISLLNVWRAIVRVGRPSPFGGPEILLPSSSFKPTYKFNINLYGFEGNTGYNQSQLTTSHTWTINGCWLVNYKLGSLNQDSNLHWRIRAF